MSWESPVEHPLVDRIRACSSTPNDAADFFTHLLHPIAELRLTTVEAPSELKLAAWVAEGKGAPGFVGIWHVNSLGKSQDAAAPLARRSFFRVGFMLQGLSSCSKALPLAFM